MILEWSSGLDSFPRRSGGDDCLQRVQHEQRPDSTWPQRSLEKVQSHYAELDL